MAYCSARFATKFIANFVLLALTSGSFAQNSGSTGGIEAKLAPFSTAPVGPPPAPWRIATLPGTSRPITQLEVVDLDGQHVLKVQADKSYGNLLHGWKGSVHAVDWRWRLDKPLLRSNLRTRDGDDVALKLCLLFDMPIDKLSAGERARLAVARALSRESLPSATLCYIWDHSLPVGTVLPNAFTPRLRYLVVDTGEARLGQWVPHHRDAAADFAAVFGAESDTLPPVTAIGVGADSDNTADSTLGYVGDVLVTP